MTDEIVFDDPRTAADFRQYVQRAKRLDGDGAIRLQAAGTVLAAWVCAIPGHGLMGHGLTLGLRTLRLAPTSAQGDWTPALSALTDRFARQESQALAMPPAMLLPEWAAMTPPRSGWRETGSVGIQEITQVAAQGIERVKAGESPDLVWAEGFVDGLSCGVAFAVHALGFAVGQTATVCRSGNWSRVTTPTGHVLTR